MEPKDFVAIGAAVVAVTSLVVNIFWNRWAAHRQQDQLRLSNRIDYQKLMLETDKMLLQHPFLIAIYDRPESTFVPGVETPALATLLATEGPEAMKQRLQLIAYASYHVNLFELVFLFAHSHRRILTPEDQEVYATWDAWFEVLVRDSSIVRGLLNRAEAKSIYNRLFMVRAGELLDKYGVVPSSAVVPAARNSSS